MKNYLSFRLPTVLVILLSLMMGRSAFADVSKKRSLFRTVGDVSGSCSPGEVRDYSQSDLNLHQQKRLAETLLRLSWIIFSDCDGHPTKGEQHRIYSVCTGDSTKLMVNVQYLCGNE